VKTLQNEDKEHIREKLLESAEYRIEPSVAKVVPGSIIGASVNNLHRLTASRPALKRLKVLWIGSTRTLSTIPQSPNKM